MKDLDFAVLELHVLASAHQVETHEARASRLLGIPQNEVTPTQRRAAKRTAFGLAYGLHSTNYMKKRINH